MGILEKLYKLKENSDFDSGPEWAIDEVIQMTIDFLNRSFMRAWMTRMIKY